MSGETRKFAAQIGNNMETKDYHVGILMSDLALLLTKDTCGRLGITISKVYNAMALEGKGVLTKYDAMSYDCVWKCLQAVKKLSFYDEPTGLYLKEANDCRREWQALLQEEVEHLERGTQPVYLSEEINRLGCSSAAPLEQLINLAAKEVPGKPAADPKTGKIDKAALAAWRMQRLRWIIRVRSDLRKYIPVLNAAWQEELQRATEEAATARPNSKGEAPTPHAIAIENLLDGTYEEARLTLRSRLDDRPSYRNTQDIEQKKRLDALPGHTWTIKMANLLGWIVDFPSQTNDGYRGYFEQLTTVIKKMKVQMKLAATYAKNDNRKELHEAIDGIINEARAISQDMPLHLNSQARTGLSVAVTKSLE